jgi:hypothetical protein
MLEIKIRHNQIGMLVEARIDKGPWQCVQQSRHKVRSVSPSVMQYSTCVDVLADEREYLEHLTAKGVSFRVYRESD